MRANWTQLTLRDEEFIPLGDYGEVAGGSTNAFWDG